MIPRRALAGQAGFVYLVPPDIPEAAAEDAAADALRFRRGPTPSSRKATQTARSSGRAASGRIRSGMAPGRLGALAGHPVAGTGREGFIIETLLTAAPPSCPGSSRPPDRCSCRRSGPGVAPEGDRDRTRDAVLRVAWK